MNTQVDLDLLNPVTGLIEIDTSNTKKYTSINHV
jgi:hypothetical protein